MSVDLEEKDFKRKLTMKKEDAEKILWSFYHRNIGDSSPVVAVSGRGYRYYITLAKSEDDVTIELWYENDCFDNNKGAFFCISLGYENEKMFEEDFPNKHIFEREQKDVYTLDKVPNYNVIALQKTDPHYYYASLYINPDNELESLQKFFENSQIKAIIEKHNIIFSDNSGKRATERIQQILARVGQGVYRENLEKLWNSACAVTGCRIREVLRASHAKPWKDCKDKDEKQRLDGHNGLLLSANYDALFDKGLISFSPLKDGWKIMISPSIEELQLENLGINENVYLNPPVNLKFEDKEKIEEFLKYHREHVFKVK